MTGRQGTPRPPTSTFIELRPRTRHTISVPPLSLASTVTDSLKIIGIPVVPAPHSHTSNAQAQAPLPLPRPPTPTRAKSAITTMRTIQKSSDPSFICTICWSPHHAPSKPRVLGRSSRIVCHQCWRAVLDLSICWVCGECIVRGDEVVSLGWCFWHRGCFGCLLCGVRLGEAFLRDCESESERGVEFGDGNRNGNGSETGDGSARKGTELDKIPLCECCETETKIKGYGEKKVLERGLENVTKSDGGLTRSRLEKLDEDKGLGGKKDVVVGLDGEEMVPSTPSSSSSISPMDTKMKSTRSTMMNERKIRKLIRESSTPQEEIALLSDASKMGVSEDGNPEDSTHSHSDSEPANFGQCELSNSSSSSNLSSPSTASNIYVSIYDPAGRAFVPSKTKPLPKWMSLLPNNVHREREDSHGDFCERNVGTMVSRATLPDAYADGASSSHSEDCPGGHGPLTPCPTEEESKGGTSSGISGDVTPTDQTPNSQCAKSTSDSTSTSTRRPSVSTLSSLNIPSPQQRSPKTTRPRSVSIEEKLPRPNQHPASAYRRANRSSTIESALNKPGDFIQTAQYPDHAPKDISERPLTPYPKEDDPFQASPFNTNNTHPRAQVPSLLTSPLSNFITPRKGSCCGLSTSLESASVGELKRRERGESSFDSTFESFPRPEIGKSNSNYATSLRMSPTLGFLDRGSEYLERYVPGVILPGGSAKEKEGERERDKEKEGIVERLRRQRVGTVSLGQVAQNVKDKKEKKRTETHNQTEWNWTDHEAKNTNVEEGNNTQMNSRTSSRRNRGVTGEEEKSHLSRSGSKRSLRKGRGSEERGQSSRTGSRTGSKKSKEKEREKLERRDVKGKGKEIEKEIVVEEDIEQPEEETGENGTRKKLKRELKGLFGEE
ncbi:hypothetical protein SS1G_07101 [Sclerotinia sclerotiorum 1980 UF-70]|uniref:LIM zinc-binding domain-containing protein n=2 Tax=Sclerotinia sclerotiorum (strain ATCC 18683 / 1980 / Ss-1) TaxID=665079 RepID=A7EP52_SCLS1|nr:hypothetical protein SS1G_07101 [Sclerotinia sclerotiorum 1980 UF-70]APA10412.1 hypothetical protein sscle_06g051820 [Sclerotinia sclerotiorum 1980 UF-70]EDO04618.1 hypothetical protein SS1G_07101 [Sclerotinia sclerotiorum 1980 UF-70]